MGFFNAVSEIAGKCRVWSHAKVERKCLEVGHELAQAAKINGGLTIEQVRSAYGRVLPKGLELQVVSDPKAVEDFAKSMRNGNVIVDAIKHGTSSAFYATNSRGERLLYLDVAGMSTVKTVSTAPHELEHVLNREKTLYPKIENLLDRIGFKVQSEYGKTHELVRDLIHQMGLFNPTEGQTQKGLFEYLRVGTRNEMEGKLSESVRKVLEPQSEKANVRKLKSIRRIVADESRAYRVGGKAAREYSGLQEGKTTSEVASELFGETTAVITKEIRAQRIKRWKRRFGLNVQDYEGVPKPQVSDTVLVPRSPEELAKQLKDHPEQSSWSIIST